MPRFRLVHLVGLLLLTSGLNGATPPAGLVRAIDFAGDRVGWAVGVGGSIWKTETGGSSWGLQISPSPFTLRDVVALDEMRALAVGDYGTIVSTVDGGRSWSIRSFPTWEHLRSIWLFGSHTFVRTESGTVLRMQNGGSPWVDARPSATHSRRRPVRRPAPEPATLVRIGDIASFHSSHYGVTGTAEIISDRLIRVTRFSSNGSAPGIDIRIGLSTNSRRDFAVIRVIGRQTSTDASFDLEIPDGITLDDFDTFTIWCFEFDVLIAEGRFQRP